MKNRIVKPWIVVISILVLFVVIWGASLIRCEALTAKYSADFATAHANNSWINDAESYKVLHCDGETAEVYYISEDLGAVLEFQLQNGIWTETTWRAVWAKHGSASNTVWPYWWHNFFR